MLGIGISIVIFFVCRGFPFDISSSSTSESVSVGSALDNFSSTLTGDTAAGTSILTFAGFESMNMTSLSSSSNISSVFLSKAAADVFARLTLLFLLSFFLAGVDCFTGLASSWTVV